MTEKYLQTARRAIGILAAVLFVCSAAAAFALFIKGESPHYEDAISFGILGILNVVSYKFFSFRCLRMAAGMAFTPLLVAGFPILLTRDLGYGISLILISSFGIWINLFSRHAGRIMYESELRNS